MTYSRVPVDYLMLSVQFSFSFSFSFSLSFSEYSSSSGSTDVSSEAPWVQSTKTVVAVGIYTNIHGFQVGLVKPYIVFARRFQQFRTSSFFSNWPTPKFWGYFRFDERQIPLDAGVYFRLSEYNFGSYSGSLG